MCYIISEYILNEYNIICLHRIQSVRLSIFIIASVNRKGLFRIYNFTFGYTKIRGTNNALFNETQSMNCIQLCTKRILSLHHHRHKGLVACNNVECDPSVFMTHGGKFQQNIVQQDYCVF